jgi:hypothetical protein
MASNTRNYPCIFAHPSPFLRGQIDPRIDVAWKRRFEAKAPFGNLRRLWREEHCAELNPYGSDGCPYSEEECSLAFFQAVERTVFQARDKRSASGYFRAVARSAAFRRADEKPLAREQRAKGPGYPRAAQVGPLPGRRGSPEAGNEVAVRSRLSRPDAIGSLLAGLDLGPREGPADDGEAGAER